MTVRTELINGEDENQVLHMGMKVTELQVLAVLCKHYFARSSLAVKCSKLKNLTIHKYKKYLFWKSCILTSLVGE